jgi:hypothetical protein
MGMNGFDGGGVSQAAGREAPTSLTQRTNKCHAHKLRGSSAGGLNPVSAEPGPE